MKNYLICNFEKIIDVDGNILGGRICDVSETTFPVSNDFEWKEHAKYFDIYTGQWYWSDRPTEYVPPVVLAINAEDQPTSTGTQDL
jgi:hypothetical protein